MNETEEALKQFPEQSDLLKAIENLSSKIDKSERNNIIQFESISEGIVYNSAKFDRLAAVVFNARSDISNLRADVKELTEEIHQMKKEPVM